MESLRTGRRRHTDRIRKRLTLSPRRSYRSICVCVCVSVSFCLNKFVLPVRVYAVPIMLIRFELPDNLINCIMLYYLWPSETATARTITGRGTNARFQSIQSRADCSDFRSLHGDRATRRARSQVARLRIVGLRDVHFCMKTSFV